MSDVFRQLNTKCKACPMVLCDFISRECRLSPSEVARTRPDLISEAFRLQRHSQRMNAAKRHKRRVWIRTEFVPDTSMAARYDRRRKKDTPKRQRERLYRANRKMEAK